MAVKHTYRYCKSRSGGGIDIIEETRELSRGTAIRFFCVDCSGGNYAQVKDCFAKKCPLYPFRMSSTTGKVHSSVVVVNDEH